MASLTFQPLGQIHASFGDIHLTTGVANHRLAVPVHLMGTWLDANDPQGSTQALLTGSVWTDQPSYRWVAGLEPQVVALRGYAPGEELTASLMDDQLICLERARGQDDVVFRIKLQATLLDAPAGVHPVDHDELPVRIPKTCWMELLDQAGTEVGVLIRVSSPLTDLADVPASFDEDVASLAQAAARLRQARAELRDQQWEHCVATCRRVLENVSRLVDIPSAKSVGGTPVERRTQNQRWAAIYWEVKAMASAAHHDDDTTEGFSWGRADAEAVLAATAGLLAKYTQS